MKRLQLNNTELYNVWKGELYIQEQRACNIKFKSSGSCSIPVQLPNKLEIKEVISLSELRKALPVQIFDQISFTGQEGCFKSTYYTLYAVKTSSINGFDFDKLLEWMKDQELALIKVLHDQGFLILLTSPALQCSEGLSVKDSFQLYALFLFPNSKLLDNTGREDLGYKLVKEDISFKITELLPGLQYAILETRQMQKGKDLYPDTLVEQHFKQFASLQRKNFSVGELRAETSNTSSLFSGHGKDIADKSDQLFFSRLQSYFSSPVNFSVPLVKMSSLLKEEIPLSSDSEKCGKNVIGKDSVALESKIPLLAANNIKSDGSSGNHVLNENKKQPAKKRTFKKGGRRGARKGKRKLKHQTALSSSATSENQVASKKRKLIGGDQEQAVSSNRTTVKLASVPNTHRRKRGAEVLTAEFVIDDKVSETETTVTNKKSKAQSTVLKNKLITGKARKTASTDTHVVRDRPPKRKASDPGNRKKLPEVKAKSAIVRRPVIKDKEQSGKQYKRTTVSINTVPFEPVVSISKTSMDHNLTVKQSAHLAPVPENDIMEKRISMYESHALNLLADLALNSLSSSSISYINSESTTPISEPVVQEKVPDSDGGNAVEYLQNDSSPPLQSSTAFEEPAQAPDCVKGQPKAGSDASQVNNTAQQRTENTEKPSSHKMLLAAAKAKARNNTPSKICLEHSYSQLPREDAPDKSTKDLSEKPSQSVSELTLTSPDSEVVLDQPSDLLISREFLHLTGDNGSPSLNTDPREVSKFQDNFFITFKWEAKYDFDLDSKFTSDPLEKTINRALHGPWNPNLKEKVEDVKIILHMWLALFYSKPNQQVISSSRKVVEHSNPAKYVSINTVHDPLCEIADTDDAENGDESNLLSNSPQTQPQIMSDVSPVWHEMKENHSSSQPVDLSVASRIQTKDYNIKLSSEIFQIYNQSSLSALYTNSLQTTVMCKMTSSSKVAPPPTNNMNTIFSANIPTVCYTDDSKQFNTELTAKTETCMAIGGGSSGKVNSREIEHEYSKHLSNAEETEMSSDSEKGFSMLHEDSCSTVSKNAESVENYMPVSPGPVSRIQVEALNDGTSDGNHQTTTRSEVIPHEHTYVTSSTVGDTEISPSDALNVNNTSDVFHEDDGHSDTEEEILKKRSPLALRIQNIPANTEQHESILESVGDIDLLEAKLQGVNMDSAVEQLNEDKEQDTSNVHLGVTNSNGSKLGICEENYHTNDLKSSRFRENLSALKSLKYGSNTTLLKDGKALASGIRLSDDKLLTFERPNTSRIFLEFVHREKASMPSGSQEQAKSKIDLLAKNTKEVDSCTGIECNDGKASVIDLKITANSIKEATTSSSTNETLGKRSDEREECPNESLPAKKDTHEIAPFGNMGKLELSPSSSEISDIEDMNTEKTVEETLHADKKPDRVDTPAEAPVAVFHQDDDRSPEDDRFQVNRNTVAIQIAHHSTDINETEETEENLPVQSQSPSQPCDIGADQIDNLTTASADFQEKGTEAIEDIFLQPKEGENISEIDERENPPDNTQTLCDQEVGPLISAEISEEDGKTYFEEKSLSHGSEASKVVDSESLGEKASLLSTDSSKAADLECISVFEKLSLKAAEEIFTTPISTLAKKQEFQIHDLEIFPADKETMDNNPSVDLLDMQTDLDIEDHLDPNQMEIGNSCEVLQTPSSEAMDEVIPAITVVGKSKSYETIQDSGGATNQPVSKCVDTNELFIESQSDSTSDDVNVSLSQSEKSTKDQTEIRRERLRKEILSRLKLICRGSGIGQHASSNSEDEVFIVHEKPGKEHTGEQTKQTDTKIGDFSKHEINTVSLLESTSEIQDNQTPELDILEEEIVQEIEENNPSINLTESVICQEVEQPVSQDKYVSPLRDDFTDNIDQDTGQNQSEICCILNTGSISKEQYDRWSETSDDDIEFVRAYKEPLAHKTSKYLQKGCHEFPSSPAEALASHSEPSNSRKEKHSKRNSGPSTSRGERGEYVSRYHRDTDYSSPKHHRSFIITKKLRDVGRTWPTVHKESIYAGKSDYDSLFANRRMVSSDLTQNTLDMEHLRFMCRLKEVLRKSSTDVHIFEPPFQTIFDSRRIPGCPRSRTKCINPLLITVRCTPHRRDYRGHDSLFPSSSYSQAYEDELRDKPTYYSRTPKKVRTRRYSPPYHFNRLRHESSLEKPNSDISVIIRECTQSNHLKLSRVGLGGTAVERTSACSAPEESDRQLRQTFDPTSTKSQTVGNIISDLCTNLCSRLHGVARESTQKNCYFYLSKTNVDQDDDDFFSLTKSLLIKDGYTPIEPRDFCDREQEESNKLLVILRNENVSTHIHKIPCLLQLRLLPNVTFAGVDTPEDLAESMYQELLQSGGFVVSDRAVLENITIDKLKEVLTILEKLSRTSAWKWLIHYGDYRKLKEDKRAESASRVKIPLLKSYQQSNIIEIMPYHRCDSKSKDLSSDLECLLSLQSQHIRSRLAVFLTVMPSTEAEKLEQNGTLVYDVDTFIRRIQKVDAQLQPSFWS